MIFFPSHDLLHCTSGTQVEYIDRSQRDEYGTVEAADPSGPMMDGYVVNNHS